MLAWRTLQQQPLFENALSKNVAKITPKKLRKFMEKVMKIHLVVCIRFGPHFSWILPSFLGPFQVKIHEKPLPTGFRKINEFWRPYFPHFWWILSRIGGPRPGPKITKNHKNATFYLTMEMSRGIWAVLKGLP